MSNYLDPMIRCVSHVTTRLRYVLKSEETTGSPKRVVTLQVYQRQYEYVTNVYIDLNALNGVLTTNDTAFGVDLVPTKEG